MQGKFGQGNFGQCKFGLRIVLMALLSFLALSLPHQAQAQQALTAAQVQADCSDGTKNQIFQNNRGAAEQAIANHVHQISLMYPITSALSACVTNMTNLIANLPSLANPFAGGGMIISAIIAGIVSQVCSAVMGEITSVQQAFTQMTKICIPLPSFSPFELSSLSTTSCSGGLALNTVSTFAPSPPTTYYSPSYFYGPAGLAIGPH